MIYRFADLNLGFELLVVDVDGIFIVALSSASEQTVGHFDIQQVVQHLNFSLNRKE